MNIVIITQDDPFYLAKNIDYLIENLPKGAKVVGCVVFDVSPFGKRESFTDKIKRTHQIFGTGFLIRYGIKFVLNKLDSSTKVDKVLNKHNIPIITLDKRINHEESLAKIGSYKPDLLVSIAGNQIFKQPLLDLAPKGCLNLHTALLPKYRGLMPTFWVLKNDEEFTGVSVFFVDEGIDSGPIVVQKKVAINGMSQQDLIVLTKKLGMDAINEAIDLIMKDEVKLIPNPEEEKSYFTFPTKEDVREFRRKGKRFY